MGDKLPLGGQRNRDVQKEKDNGPVCVNAVSALGVDDPQKQGYRFSIDIFPVF